MKPRKKIVLRAMLATLVLSAIAIFSASSLVHLCYRLATTEAEKQNNTLRYHQLANDEITANGDEQILMREERMKLYYWFHARGWGIDEDEESQSRPWEDLQIHWNNNKKANKAEMATPRKPSD